MQEDIVMLIGKIAAYSSILPIIIVFVIRFKIDQEKKILAILVGVSAFFEFFSIWISAYLGNNLPLLHIYTIIEFILLVGIFRIHLKPNFSNLFFVSLIISFIAVAIANAFLIETPFMFNDYSRALESLLLIFLVLCFFYKTLNELLIERLEQSPMFWISMGVLIYFSGSLFIFIFGNYFLSSEQTMYTAWGIHAIFSILLNIFYSIALWVRPKVKILN